MKHTFLSAALASLLLAGCGGAPEPAKDGAAPAATADSAPADKGVVNVYNWSDYIAPDTVAKFEAETGIKVVYDVFDSNQLLEAKLMSGDTGYDIVVPSLSFLARQVQAGVFLPLDRSKLTNYGNLDPVLLQRIAQRDPDNAHAVPYLWGTTGIGYNVDKVREVLGPDAPVGSWDLVLKPENMQKLADCGVSFLDEPSEIFPTVLNWLGEEPNSFDEAVIAKGLAALQAVRPHIRQFHSSQYINDLANGDICVAVGWSGDVMQAADRAKEAGKGVNVTYTIPQQGAVLYFDMLAIPKSAKNVDNAHAFIDFLMRPEVIAEVTNTTVFPNGNAKATPMVEAEIASNPNIYPPDDVANKLFTLAVVPAEVDRIYTRMWTTLKSSQ